MIKLSSKNQEFPLGVLGFFLFFVTSFATANLKQIQARQCSNVGHCLLITADEAQISRLSSAWALKKGQLSIFDKDQLVNRVDFISGFWRPDQNLLRLTGQNQEWLVLTDQGKILSETIN